MSTFLQLVNSLMEECGITGQSLATLSGAYGEQLRCKNWINEAYMDVQRKHPDWEWLRTSFSFPTVASQQVYTLSDIGISATFGRWHRDTFRIYVTGLGYGSETYLFESEYESWRDLWQFGANRSTTARPVTYAILPNKSVGLGPTPNATGYTCLGDYYTTPAEMSADADYPAFPAKYHRILVYRAMMAYGAFEAASEVYQRGEQRYKGMLSELEADQLPAPECGRALA